jgi:hypothetical protein
MIQRRSGGDQVSNTYLGQFVLKKRLSPCLLQLFSLLAVTLLTACDQGRERTNVLTAGGEPEVTVMNFSAPFSLDLLPAGMPHALQVVSRRLFQQHRSIARITALQQQWLVLLNQQIRPPNFSAATMLMTITVAFAAALTISAGCPGYHGAIGRARAAHSSEPLCFRFPSIVAMVSTSA